MCFTCSFSFTRSGFSRARTFFSSNGSRDLSPPTVVRATETLTPQTLGTIYALINRRAVMDPRSTRVLELSVYVGSSLGKGVMACVYLREKEREKCCRESLSSSIVQMDVALKSIPCSYFLTCTFTLLLSFTSECHLRTEISREYFVSDSIGSRQYFFSNRHSSHNFSRASRFRM